MECDKLWQRVPRVWLRGFTAVILGAVLLLATAAGWGGRREIGRFTRSTLNFTNHTGDPAYTGPTRVFIIETDQDARALAELHATNKKEIMFTTYAFTHKGHYSYDAIHPAKHMWQNLKEIGMLEHTFVLSYDVHSCQVMWEHGIPCFLDRYLPQPKDLPGQYKSHTPHWYQKYAWALKFLELGYVTVFMEFDAIFFESPFPYYNPALDLEGLSDWQVTTLGGPKERFVNPCRVYHMQKGQNNDNYLDWGFHRPEDVKSSYHINPCMSTGFWFVQPRKIVRDFLESFIDLMLHWRNWQVDQILWNEVVMAFLIGHGSDVPLKTSILNTTRFCNFGIDEDRKKNGLPRQPVLLHGGGMKGHEKEPYMRAQGYWKAENWDGTGAQSHIQTLSKRFQLKQPY